MVDSAINASRNESIEADGLSIIERIEQFAEENPKAKQYWIDSELEAAEILVAMAASLKLLLNDENNDEEGRKTLNHYASEYRRNVAQGKALQYFRSLSDRDALEIYGLRILAKSLIH